MYKSILSCPIGTLEVLASDNGITRITLNSQNSESSESNKHSDEACDQLREYFKGIRKRFDVVLDLGGTDFEQAVWNQLLQIPYGKTTSYGNLARKLSSIKAVRAVGRANGKNPIPIIVPCHRVIGSNGSLTGYALGLKTKQFLLNLEQPGVFGTQLALFKSDL